jgi:hypothetical protein
MLLAREKTTALGAIERLVALQAQLARPPYIRFVEPAARTFAVDVRPA